MRRKLISHLTLTAFLTSTPIKTLFLVLARKFIGKLDNLANVMELNYNVFENLKPLTAYCINKDVWSLTLRDVGKVERSAEEKLSVWF